MAKLVLLQAYPELADAESAAAKEKAAAAKAVEAAKGGDEEGGGVMSGAQVVESLKGELRDLEDEVKSLQQVRVTLRPCDRATMRPATRANGGGR